MLRISLIKFTNRVTFDLAIGKSNLYSRHHDIFRTRSNQSDTVQGNKLPDFCGVLFS